MTEGSTDRKYVIFDLDGTLIDIKPIQHLIGQWDEFHEATMTCPPISAMVEFARRTQLYSDIIIVTGKPRKYYQRVIGYLSALGIQPEAIVMRPEGNTQSDADLKVAAIERYLGRGWQDRILFAVEDRDKMVDAWRASGIVCFQCAASLY